MKITPGMLQSSFIAPRNPGQEKGAKERMLVNLRDVARAIARLESAQEALEAVADQKAKECPRWQAHHALMSVALSMRICHLNEYSNSLGAARKEYPPRDATKKGWRLDASEPLLDPTTKKTYRQVTKQLDELTKAYAGTAWAQVAETLKKTPLSVIWVQE
jgi:hypothetical protein